MDLRNRPVNEARVAAFMKQFQEGHFYMKEFPGVVDSNFCILDGQHRFEACKRMGLPFYFHFSDTLTIENVTNVQLNAGWKLKDYLHSFVQQKNMNYIILHRFVERYKFGVSVACMLLAQNAQGLTRNGYYAGNFKVKFEEKAHNQSAMIAELAELTGTKGEAFVRTLVNMMINEQYDHKRMVKQLKKYAFMFKRMYKQEDQARNLEEIYNYRIHSENKVRFL
jgi:hypothetical protein